MNLKKIKKFCAVIIGISGLVILISTLYPILSYEWEAGMKYPVLISPLMDEQTASFKFEDKDYTKLSQWFEGREEKMEIINDTTQFFTLSIPKLSIDNAIVKVGGEELSGSLIQYPGTALPGNIGNSVIFGHSILPQFYDPKNYLAIFSTLNQLDEGDLIYVSYNGKLLKYQIEAMFEVKPQDIQILEQNSVNSYLTLVTCTPPGHPLKPKRLIVRAKLIEIG